MFPLCPGFTSEAELLSHLKSSYEKTVAERDSSLVTGVQQLVSAVKTFLVAESDLEVRHMIALNDSDLTHFYLCSRLVIII